MQYADLATLDRSLAGIRDSPDQEGTVRLIVRRPAVEEREVLEEAELDPAEGLAGDCWRTRGSRGTADGSAHPDMQLTLMNGRVAAAVAGPEERWGLAGDQLYVDLDLSANNLPPGTRLKVGTARIEITAEPHTGCGKFARRFGADALKFLNSEAGRELSMRGIYARVVEAGTVRRGDPIVRLDR